ncbi:M56 family metallopeptidase [Pseudofrankia inefficax]|uniref:Peptidase M48 Ste24p n=1 Tax=Pseudofrankia inefficax (strain DSM 45817 / CECT 9037 / DDB 130130 / EuI1c) TaxID=298654 RepID=E3IUN5_PSEI1|nr:M56 family metallopeptidase [Pseudofrankia inefficax]ADP84851.1 peptidase M48 Ste24p [Pseudofrankia inefficax]
MTTAAALTLFAAVLAWPVPRLLAGARWTHGCPRAAIVLWQAIGLAGGVCALLAAVAFTVAPLSGSTPRGITHHVHNLAKGQPLSGLDWLSVVGLGLVAALASRLFGVLASSTFATLRRRSHHRNLVDLTGDDHTDDCRAAADLPASAPRPRHHRIQDWTPLASIRHGYHARGADGCELCGHVGLRILDHPVAVAYCVPGVRHARVVVSRGLLTTLGPRELRAVLAHEDAHVTGRHDLVIQPFIAWQQTFPFLRPAWEATAAVSLLVEMLADDAAARRTSGSTLARALAQLGVTRSLIPAGTLGVTGSPDAPGAGSPTTGACAEPGGAEPPSRSPVIARIVRLLDPPAVPWWQPAAAYAAAAVILAAPFLLLAV